MLLSRVIYIEGIIGDIMSLKHPAISHMYFCLFVCLFVFAVSATWEKKLISQPNFKKQKKAL